MAALELIVQEYIEEWRHLVFNLSIRGFGESQKHLDEFRRYIAGDDFAVPPVIVLQTAVLERQLDPLRLFVPTVDLKGLGLVQCDCDIRQPLAVVCFRTI